MFDISKRPFAAPNAVIYSHELSKPFLGNGITSVFEVGCGIGIFAFRYASSHRDNFVVGVDLSKKTIECLGLKFRKMSQEPGTQGLRFLREGLCLERVLDAVYSSDVRARDQYPILRR